MAGTIPLSMTQQFNEFGEPLSGGLLSIYVAGTVSTPQDAFQDYALTTAMPHPMTLDAAGRIPQFFLADGFVKVRLTDAQGVVQLSADYVLVIGPPTVEDEEPSESGTGLIEMGDMICRYGTGARTGFVRCNNNTIGSTLSGATERANTDCNDLYEYLWATDATLPVIGGRGATAADDWAADKPITLPDWRGYALGGIDDMGGGFSGRLNATYFPNPTVLGSASGSIAAILEAGNLPPQTPAGTVGLTIGAVTLVFDPPSNFNGLIMYGDATGTQSGGGSFDNANGTITLNQAASSATFTGTAFAGQVSTPFPTFGPRKNCTIYIKL